MQSTKNVKLILDYLKKLYPNPQCELNYETPFQLLIAVILSAQCTDKRVNLVTPLLFTKYKTIESLATAKLEEVEEIIRPLGFYVTKSKVIINCAKEILDKFGGEVPNDVDKLQSIKGVGRKTANVVTAELFNANNLGVDTHVFRISHRLGLSDAKTPYQVEKDLVLQLKNENLVENHLRFVLFGRYFCKAIKPNCEDCELSKICNYKKGNK